MNNSIRWPDLGPLIPEVAKGDGKAIKELSGYILPVVYSICRSLGIPKFYWEDAFQVALTKVWKGSQNYKDKGYANSWVFRIIMNSVIDIKRRLSPQNHGQDQEKYVSPRYPNDFSLIVRVLMSEVSKLPEEQQIVVIEHALNGLSYKEIGEKYGWNVHTVRSRMFRARKRLFRMLSPFYNSG